jgi:hypothetical protein
VRNWGPLSNRSAFFKSKGVSGLSFKKPKKRVVKNEENSAPSKNPGGLFSFLFALATMGVLVLCTADGIKSKWWDAIRSVRWHTVYVLSAKGREHKVRTIGVRGRSAYMTQYDCTFSYKVDDHLYESTQESLIDAQFSACSSRTSARVNPNDPEDAVIFREITGLMVSHLVFFSIALGLMIGVICSKILAKKPYRERILAEDKAVPEPPSKRLSTHKEDRVTHRPSSFVSTIFLTVSGPSLFTLAVTYLFFDLKVYPAASWIIFVWSIGFIVFLLRRIRH